MWVLGIPSVCIAGFIVPLMIHATVAAYHFPNGETAAHERTNHPGIR